MLSDASQKLLKALQSSGLLLRIPPTAEILERPEGLIRALARCGYLDETVALQQLSNQVGIPLLDLDDLTLDIDVPSFVGALDPALLWKYRIVPIKRQDENVWIAISNPYEFDGIQAISFALGTIVHRVLAPDIQISHLLERHFSLDVLQFDSLDSTEQGEYIEIVSQASTESESVLDVSAKSPVVRLCNKLLVDAVRERASDIHLEPSSLGVDIRHRIDGVMHSVIELPRRLQGPVTARFKILAGMDISERRKPQDGRLRIRVQNEELDLRASAIPTAHGEKLVLRILRGASQKSSLRELGMPQKIERRALRSLDARGRLILVTGPTGSGKTTTLYTFLQYLKDGSTNIVTVEDPIEYRMAGINQTQINAAIDVSFASALRSVLRQDPDIIMIGEIRDLETAEIALQAAQTGHLVLSTLHTNDAPSAVTRLLTLGVDRGMLAASLGGIVAQRLVRRLCSHCVQQASPAFLEPYQETIDLFKINATQFKMPRGCERCGQRGYFERVGIYSYLDVVEAVRREIHNHSTVESIELIAAKSEYTTIAQEAISLVQSGVTDLSEVHQFLLSGESDTTEKNSSSMPLEQEFAVSNTISEGRKELPTLLFVQESICEMGSVAKLLSTEFALNIITLDACKSLPRHSHDSLKLIVFDSPLADEVIANLLEVESLQTLAKEVPLVRLHRPGMPSTRTLKSLRSGPHYRMKKISTGSSPVRLLNELRSLLPRD